MSEFPPPPAAGAADPPHRLRFAALTAVVIGVMGLAAAAFVLSYPDIRNIALEAGVAVKLARFYPLIFDAMLVIAGAAALTMRGAGVWMRIYVWLSLLILLGAVAAGDALQAMNVPLPTRPARVVAAVTPWVLLLLGFGFWLAMLRQFRRSRSGSRRRKKAGAQEGGEHAAVTWAAPGRSGLDLLLEPRAGQPPVVARTEPAPHTPTTPIPQRPDAGYGDEPFIVHESSAGSPAEAGVDGGEEAVDPRAADDDSAGAGRPGESGDGEGDAGAHAPVPPFDRLHSTPTPPHPTPPQPTPPHPTPSQPTPPHPTPPHPTPPQD